MKRREDHMSACFVIAISCIFTRPRLPAPCVLPDWDRPHDHATTWLHDFPFRWFLIDCGVVASLCKRSWYPSIHITMVVALHILGDNNITSITDVRVKNLLKDVILCPIELKTTKNHIISAYRITMPPHCSFHQTAMCSCSSSYSSLMIPQHPSAVESKPNSFGISSQCHSNQDLPKSLIQV